MITVLFPGPYPGHSRGFGRTPYFDGRIFILSVSGSLKHLSIDTMIYDRFRLAFHYKNYGNT